MINYNKSDKEYYEKNKRIILTKAKKYYIENKVVINKRNALWKTNNLEKVRAYKRKEAKQYRIKYPEKVKLQNKVWKENNKDYGRNYAKKYYHTHIKQNINLIIQKNLRKGIWDTLKGNSKSERTMRIVGCSIQELRQHLEKQFTFGMNWKNYGFGWHIDHIKPIKIFNLSNKEELQKCFHYTNLQPLWAIENIKKGGFYDKQ